MDNEIDLQTVMKESESLGTERNKKVYMNNGAAYLAGIITEPKKMSLEDFENCYDY